MNLFEYTIPTKDEEFTLLLKHKNITINRIVSSDTLKEKIYIQDEDEWVVVLEGEAILWIDKQERKLIKGDMLFIPAKTPHRVVETTAATLWLAVYID